MSNYLAFMEQGVSRADRVLLIFTPIYCKRATERIGGVGYESIVMTGELAGKLDTKKFIGLLRTGTWDDSVPTFLKSRFHVDFSDDTTFNVAYEELLHDIHNVPVYSKPPLGKNPFTDQSIQQSGFISNLAASTSQPVPTSKSIKNVLVPPVGPRIVRSWFDAVINPLIRGLESERSRLEKKNWSWQARPTRLEYIYSSKTICALATDTLEQFLSFYPDIKETAEIYDQGVWDLFVACQALHSVIQENEDLKSVYYVHEFGQIKGGRSASHEALTSDKLVV